ncbi:hypothetical protein F4860DRAFT_498050 [Xylaria cubensis]|nr:hypothetical protein F4860DRAFT_498050 [Xylaria cubensis]
MSFGWSAGDIVAAVTVVHNLIKALDSCDGAASEYRETVSYLHHLKRTLEPLQTFTTFDENPTLAQDIEKEVRCIRGSVEGFLSSISNYEHSLGAKAKKGHLQHVPRKLKWHFSKSKDALSLKKNIKSHMRIIDTLMQRLTLDSIRTIPQKLADEQRDIIPEMIRQQLIAVLREYLPPLISTRIKNYQEIQSVGRDGQDSRLELLSPNIEDINKNQISSRMIFQQSIESCCPDAPKTTQKMLASAGGSELDLDENIENRDQSSGSTVRRTSEIIGQESLQEVYYLAFLYLGHFLRNFFGALSRLVQPSQTLTPTLLSKYHITFLDAIGRQPRILPYDCFRSFKILEAFIQHEFKDLPGTAWVNRGRYLIFSLTNNQVLDEHNWSSIVAPGTRISMSMLLQKRLVSSSNLIEQRCPEISCSGTWTRPITQSWVTCPVCQKEIFNSMSAKDERGPVRNVRNDLDSRNDLDLEPRSTLNRSVAQDIHSQERAIEETPQLDENIAIFKRVVQQFVVQDCENQKESHEHRNEWKSATTKNPRSNPRSTHRLNPCSTTRLVIRVNHRSVFEDTSDSSDASDDDVIGPPLSNDSILEIENRDSSPEHTSKYSRNLDNAIEFLLRRGNGVAASAAPLSSVHAPFTPPPPPPLSPSIELEDQVFSIFVVLPQLQPTNQTVQLRPALFNLLRCGSMYSDYLLDAHIPLDHAERHLSSDTNYYCF